MKRLGELASVLGLTLAGDPDKEVTRIGSLTGAGPDALTFLADARYRRYLADSRAGAVIVAPEDAPAVPGNALIADNPHLAFARAAQMLYPAAAVPGVDESAQVDPSAVLADGVTVSARAVVGARAQLGERTQVRAGAVIGEDVVLGADCIVHPGATVLAGCRLGAQCRVQSGAVIGSDGFGYARDGLQWERVPQVGGVVIGDNVDIGANTTIDRGAIGDTVLEDGVKVDNLVQIAHNVHVGAHTAMAACVGVSGSTRIGSYCTIAGMVGIAGHLVIGDHVHITGMTQVTKSLTEPGVYSSGTGVESNRAWRRNAARFHQLDDMARRLRALERRLAAEDGHGGTDPMDQPGHGTK